MAAGDYSFADEGPTAQQTIQRIERALARIGAAADAAASGSKPTHDLADRHEAMRSKVRAELDRLDRVIGELEQ